MELPIDMAVRKGISNEVLCKIKEQDNYIIADLSTMGVASDGTGILSWSHVAPTTHTVTTDLECQSDVIIEKDLTVKGVTTFDGMVKGPSAIFNTVTCDYMVDRLGNQIWLDDLTDLMRRGVDDLTDLISKPGDMHIYNSCRYFMGGVSMWDYVYHLPSLFAGLGIDQYRMDEIRNNMYSNNEPDIFDRWGINESPQQKMQEMRDEIEDLKMQIQDLRITLSNLVP